MSSLSSFPQASLNLTPGSLPSDPATLATVPFDIRHLILQALPDIPTLSALVHAYPCYRTTYMATPAIRRGILFRILVRSLGPSALHIACLVLAWTNAQKALSNPPSEPPSEASSEPSQPISLPTTMQTLEHPDRWPNNSFERLWHGLYFKNPWPTMGPVALAEWAEIEKNGMSLEDIIQVMELSGCGKKTPYEVKLRIRDALKGCLTGDTRQWWQEEERW